MLHANVYWTNVSPSKEKKKEKELWLCPRFSKRMNPAYCHLLLYVTRINQYKFGSFQSLWFGRSML